MEGYKPQDFSFFHRSEKLVQHTLEFTIADIESVVVSSKCRGRGYGKELMTAMVEVAKKMNAHHIQLTSNPARVAANRLYQELGFERYETNCYKMGLTN